MTSFNELRKRGADLATLTRAAKREGREVEVLPLVNQTRSYRTRMMDDGYTQPSVHATDAFADVLKQDTLLLVEARRDRNGNPYVTFYAREQSLTVGGFNWGYGGQGPCAFADALEKFGFDRETVWERIRTEQRDHWFL